MPNLILLVGPPGSGKSTLAHNLIHNDGDHGAATIRISRDDQGKAHFKLYDESIAAKKDIILDKMNFAKNARKEFLDKAKAAGYTTKIIVLHENRATCFKRCMERPDHPTVTCEEDANNALNMFYSKYDRVTDDEADVVDRRWPGTHKTVAAIFDIDGTMANIEHRKHHVQGTGKKDWGAFFRDMDKDTVNDWCARIFKMMRPNNLVVFCSGRPDSYRTVTERWLHENRLENDGLYMRPRSDHREDSIVKEIILDFELKTRYDILMVFDDRRRVVDMWRRHGLVCLQCDPGEF